MSFRIEEKLLINTYQLSEFKEYLVSRGATKIFKTRKINNLYFDNDKFDMFNDSIEGCLPRKKIRLRNYEDERNFLEIKISSTEGRYKTSNQINLSKTYNMKSSGLFDKDYGSCKPVLHVEYLRNYFKYDDVRVTIDSNIKYFTKYRKFLGIDRNQIIELKASYFKDLNELMKDFPFPRSRFSKYTNGIERLLEH
tara:strand:+ start:418 stop:1002 length:585 start_codon:yes stop_codon:yes gene_type:complete